jgi:inward rectifier potassium channel
VSKKKEPNLPYPRILRKETGGPRPIIKGGRGRWTDLYHRLLTAPWWLFILILAAIFAGLNAVFAALYLLDPSGLANARPGSFWDAYLFSVETMASVTYSTMLPKTTYANVLVAAEAFFAILNIALATGVVFTRISRPTSRVLFSNKAIIGRYDGQPTLMFRAANQRGNQIMEATVTVTVARQAVTREGVVMRRMEELKLARARSPLFSLSWTVMHPIDKDSPFHGATRESMLREQMEVIVIMSGMDDTFADKVYARHSYLPHEIHWDKQFEDVLFVQEDGRRFVDLHKFHDIKDA